jgi:AmmeMemoRadiSam system protein B
VYTERVSAAPKDHPKLRLVEAIPIPDGRVCLRDPQGFSDKLLFLPPQIFFIVSHFDGRHSILDIQADYTRRYGDLLFSEQVLRIIEQLDEALFMDTERFAQAYREARAAFAAASVRGAAHSGISYEAEPEALRRQLDGLFQGADEPGEGAATAQLPPAGALRGLIAPHIDLARGAACYASSYAELRRAGRAGTFVILGISHTETRRRYTLTAKDFHTPLGTVPADREFLEQLGKLTSADFYEDEFAHRNEHSIEFQVLLLRYLFPKREDLGIVPVLCSSLPQVQTGEPPQANAEAEEFLAALGEVLSRRGEGTALIAGVDLSHLGRRFGQELDLTDELLRKAEADDRAMIGRVLERDADDFFRGIQQEADRRNVCGVPAIYSLLRLLPPSSARLLRYGQAPDPQTQSVVTFMSAAFYG